MKQTVKANIFKFIFFSLLFTLTIIGCKEDVIENNLEETSEEHVTSTKHLTIDNLPDLEGIINGLSVNTTSRIANTTFGDLNLSDIIEYVNEDGKESYTFKIENSTNVDSALEFENLHLIKIDEDYLAYILKWIPDYEWYKNNNFNFIIQDFTGIQKHYDLEYTLLQENEFINGLPLNSSTSGRNSSTQNSRLDYYLACTDNIVSLCNGVPYNCGGDICGYGLSTACYLSGGGGNNNGGDNTSSGNPTGGGGTHVSGGGSGSGNTSGSGYVPGGSGTVPTIPPTMSEMLGYFITLTPEQRLWIGRPENEELSQQLVDYFLLGGDSEFGEYALEIMMANPEANPFIGADCRSFEYAQPPGALQKGCAVTNFNHTFYTAGIDSSGNPYYGETDSIVSIAYFTMPSGMTNGQAANLTAIAVTNAIKATDLFYLENPYSSEYVIGEFFKDSINQSLSVVGGSISTTTPPFSIPSPAPYITSVFGISNPYNCQ